ncbi:uncharacterized protein [Macrobrachium rosenbergii]|uniref:uncharacterized protein isoform X1 n=1 Tax=Macrobrachium rosenbergii TaxID=79674 RepID=UPI0034D3B7D4
MNQWYNIEVDMRPGVKLGIPFHEHPLKYITGHTSFLVYSSIIQILGLPKGNIRLGHGTSLVYGVYGSHNVFMKKIAVNWCYKYPLSYQVHHAVDATLQGNCSF